VGESGVEASWKRDLRRGFGGKEGDGGAKAVLNNKIINHLFLSV
jgi:hypothetical protein